MSYDIHNVPGRLRVKIPMLKGQPGKVQCFEDQYISSAGQLYELMSGHDRFVADLRPLVNTLLAARGQIPVFCSHPYDLCTSLIATEYGVVVTDASGEPLDCPLDLDTDVARDIFPGIACKKG